MYLFTYGTLMRNHSNHRVLRDSKFLCLGTPKNHGLYEIKDYPYVIEEDSSSVIGEVYEIDAGTLRRLDFLECKVQLKKAVEVELENGGVITAYVYLWHKKVDKNAYIPVEQLPWKEKTPIE